MRTYRAFVRRAYFFLVQSKYMQIDKQAGERPLTVWFCIENDVCQNVPVRQFQSETILASDESKRIDELICFLRRLNIHTRIYDQEKKIKQS